MNGQLGEARERYEALLANPTHIEEVLQAGAEKARKESREFIGKLREAVGIRPIR